MKRQEQVQGNKVEVTRMDAMRFQQRGRYITLRDLPLDAVVLKCCEAQLHDRWHPAEDHRPKLVLVLDNERLLVAEGRNLDNLIEAFGPDTDQWLGQRLRLRVGRGLNGRPCKVVEPTALTTQPAIGVRAVEIDGVPFDEFPG